MALVSQCKCSNPSLVRNKYTGREVFKSCGKCISCKRARQSAWNAKLQRESKCHLYEFEVQLDYNDHFLPKYDFSKDGDYLIEVTPRLDKYYKKFPNQKKVYFKDLKFDTDADYQYFVDRLNSHWTCIPHSSVYDIQKFKKRLNTFIKREITGHYNNFRSVFVSELGGNTLRPHYHGILYFDDLRIAEKIDSLVNRAWRSKDNRPFGHARAKPSRGKLTSYIAKYITLPIDLPSFYAHHALRPLFLTSRKPPLGSLFESSSEVRYIFDNATPRKVEFEKSGELWVPKAIPIGQNIENRLFPKCPSYGAISDFDKFKLYKIAANSENYRSFLLNLFNSIFDGMPQKQVLRKWRKLSVFDAYYCAFNSNLVWFNCVYPSDLIKFVSRDLECERTFKQLFTVSKRVTLQSRIFDVSLNDYVRQVIKYHSYNKPQSLLRMFYSLQQSLKMTYSNYDDRVFYPLTYLSHGVEPHKAPDARLYKADIEQKYFDSLKNKEASDYFKNKLPKLDPILYNLCNSYYVKKRYENAKAVT